MSTESGPFPARFIRAGPAAQALQRMAGGFGMLALAALLHADANPFAPKPTHFPAKAKRIIYLVMNGGMSHVDTFDPKPMLSKYNGQPMPGGAPKTERSTGNLFASPFAFRKCGQSGTEVSEIFPRVGGLIDEFCVIRSMWTEVPNHEPSLFMFNTGDDSARPAEPGQLVDVRAWIGKSQPSRLRRAVSRYASSRLAAMVFRVPARRFSRHIPKEHGCRSVQADPERKGAGTQLESQRRQIGSAGRDQSRAPRCPLRRHPTGSFH